MLELFTFLGLALLVEGVVLALFPDAMRRMMAELSSLDGKRLRAVGLTFAAAAGCLLLVIARISGSTGDTGAALGFPVTREFLASLF